MQLNTFWFLALRFSIANAFTALLPTIFKLIYNNEDICGDVFVEPAWLPLQERCKIGCEVTSEICLVNIDSPTHVEKCRALPVECMLYLRRELRLSPVNFVARKRKKPLSKLLSRRKSSLAATAIPTTVDFNSATADGYTLESLITSVEAFETTSPAPSFTNGFLRTRSQAGQLIATNSDGTAEHETEAKHATAFFGDAQNNLTVDEANPATMTSITSTDEPLMLFPYLQPEIFRREDLNKTLVLAAPLERQPLKVSEFPIDLTNIGTTLDFFENQMQRTAPQTTTEPNERISQSQDEHYPMMWWNHEVNKQNAALYEEGREEESEGSSMPSHSVTNEENLAGDASDMWYSPPSDHRVSQFAHLDVISFALGKGSLPTRQSSTYTRSGETPENQLIVPFARGSLPFESAFWQRSVFNGAGTATPQSGMNEALSRITPFYMKSVSRPKSPQSWIEWGVDDGSTLLQKQYIPRERVESANSANAQQFEPNNAMRNVADDFGKGVSEAEQIGNSWYPGNQKRTLVIPSNNNAENLFSSESVPHSDDHMHTSVRNPQNEIAKQALADHSQWCCQWALDGLCERNWQRIRQLCPKSCGSIVCSSIGQTQSCNRVIDVDVVDCFQQQRFGVYDSKNFQSNSRMDSLPLGSMNDSVEFPNEQSRLAYRLNSKQRDDYKLLRKGTAVEREMKAWNTLKQNV